MTASAASVPHFRMYIGGQWVDTDDRYELANPANEQLVAARSSGVALRHSPRRCAARAAATAWSACSTVPLAAVATSCSFAGLARS